jgi:reactive intermediate/imine deaminase
MSQLRTAVVSVAATLAVVGLTCATNTATTPTERQYIDPRPSASAPNAPPFSGAVRVGDTLYLSGALGLDKDSRVPEDPKEEARLVLDSIHARLEKAGMTMGDLVSVQIFCSDVSHYAAFNEVYKTYFKKEYPARAFIGSGKLLADARFEVQGIAVKR